MTKRIKNIIKGAGRAFDISGTATTFAYTTILNRRDNRTDIEKLAGDMAMVGRDLNNAVDNTLAGYSNGKKAKQTISQ